ncbi:hypothetical protein [Dyadobacter psychrotolerans]|uniref:Uncharacterized protein n=1 Tax=Dyadobacter psychrotolerans TaxID=2541721 RepID=A0A4R5DM03_9BACT|nr:hypothetical protein [Dyadobacter psychrotolerans]TDE14487.1 hypothetical protein E0F88_14910 [Dyadobacter psychrotolerans]
MKIGEKLLKVLNKKYPPSEFVAVRFERYDLAIKTDSDGDAVVLFIGKANQEGVVKGNRFSRVLVKDASGKVLKDHWDHKGKT